MVGYSLADLETLTIQYPFAYYYKLLYLRALKEAGDVRYLSALGDVAMTAYDRRVLYGMMERVEAERAVSPQKKEVSSPQKEESPQKKEEEITIQDARTQARAAAFDIEAELAGMPSIGGEGAKVGGEIEDFLNAGGQFTFNLPPIERLNDEEEDEYEIPKQSEQEEEPFTETLAKIYIKQKKYDKAIKTFRGLIARFPEKSVYFADQIRFLEKLISNL